MDIRIHDIREFLSKDKRKNDRLTLPIKILYNFHLLEEWAGPFSIDDISGHGLKFTVDAKIEKGTLLNLKLLFLDETITPIIVEAKVCWCAKKTQGYSLGLEFQKMGYADRRRYIEYISEHILLKYLK